MIKISLVFSVIAAILFTSVQGQPWLQNDAIFNPSGIPSLPFSQPRFADLDGDGDFDMVIGSSDGAPVYMENDGGPSTPHFIPGEDFFSGVNSLDAEAGVFYDIDGDTDLDFITGGYTGLNLFLNTGTINNPVFEKINGFFSGLSVGSNPIPDLADTDNDGDPDLVVGMSESGIVRLYTNTGSAVSAQFSEGYVSVLGDVGLYAYPNFCDLDDDNDQDLLVGRDGHGFIYYENTGTPGVASWQPDPGIFAGIGNETYWNSPGLADLNGDGNFDLIFGTASGPLNYYINTGTASAPVWLVNTSLFGGVIDVGGASNPYFYDYDNDGDFDMFTGSQAGDIKYFKNIGTSSGPAWEENSGGFTSLKHSIYSAVAIGDVNGDGYADAVVGDLSGKLYYHQKSGLGFTLISGALQHIVLGGWSSPRLSDFDNDGDLDIVAGNEAGNLSYIENQGSAQSPDWVLINGYFAGIDVGSNCVPALCDLDYDNDPDILCGDSWGGISYFENQAGVWVEKPGVVSGIQGNQNAAPAFGDLDGDGDPDLALGQYDGTFSYYQNRFLTTGFAGNKHQTAPSKARIYPNPMGTNASVEFHVNAPSEVSLQAVNNTGKIVLDCNLGILPAGYHTHRWDTGLLKPGSYFIRINTAEEQIFLKAFKIR